MSMALIEVINGHKNLFLHTIPNVIVHVFVVLEELLERDAQIIFEIPRSGLLQCGA